MRVQSAFSLLFGRKGTEFTKMWFDAYKYAPEEYPELVEYPRKNFQRWRQSEVWYVLRTSGESDSSRKMGEEKRDFEAGYAKDLLN